jgi:ubiquinone/menaquinone biosynthesis C-methylase UbiE
MSTEKRSPWSYIQPWDVDSIPVDILDEEQRRGWMRAMFVAGGLPYMWRELAEPMRDVVYALLELHPGDNVLMIGEGVEPCGFATDIQARIGSEGKLDVFEIIRDGRAAVASRKMGRNGKIGCWRWEYTNGVADNTYDAVAVMQSAQHCDDWNETGAELVRVLRPGKMLVSAEMCLEGDRFKSKVDADVHIRQWYDKMFPTGRNEISNYTGEELLTLIGPHVSGGKSMDWRGIELFWGRKPYVIG